MKTTIDKAEVDRLVSERLEEERQKFIDDCIPVISMNYGNTYITIKRYDIDTYQIAEKIRQLLDMMGVDYVQSMIMMGREYYFCIHGEDADRAAFIQKFIDNGLKLSWK